MKVRSLVIEWLAWLGLGLALLAPAWLRGELVGHPDVDVWNHAWGLWWWAFELSRGQFPFHTELISTPGGGTLWFADPVGAASMLPVTLLAGPATAWNLLLSGRIAWAGFHARRLAREMGGDGPHTIVAGLAYATTPFLLAELHNGISEVCGIGWTAFALWTGIAAVRDPSRGRWVLAGLALGGATFATPYYGLGIGLAVAPILPFALGGAPARWRGALLGSVVAAALAGLAVGAWKLALAAPDAVIQRPDGSQGGLAIHNAVDLREYLVPGQVQAHDFTRDFGKEAFVHTVYMRWSVLALAAVATLRDRHRWPWWVAVAVSVVLSMGERPWFDKGFLWDQHGPRLPFGVLVDLIPGVSITHPARLVLPAQAVLCGLAGAALAGLGRRAWLLIPVVLVESALASAARWPVSTSGPAIPPVYARIATDGDPRGVLDLPPMVRRTMRTCVYFWYQTRHHHPIPWWPDVRTDHNGDVLLVRRFTPQPLTTVRNSGFTPLDAVAITELRARYGWVVVHTEFDQRTKGGGGSTDLLSAAFGPPETEGSLRIWRLPAIEGQNR